MSKAVSNGKKTDVRNKKGQFKRGNPGKPKGAKDKVARSVKEDMEETIEGLGGIKGIIEWAKKSNGNREKLYGWYFSMLPKNIDADVSGDLGIIINRIITNENPNKQTEER